MNDNFIKAMWTRGDYAILGDWFAEASRACLHDLPLTDRTLLDVACGTGAVALEATRRGARVTAVDITPAMLTEARRRAAAADLTVDWHEGSFNDLAPYGLHDIVTSAFGVIFAPDPHHVAAQLHAATAPGGLISLTAWHPDGSFGLPPEAIYPLLPALKSSATSTHWATRAGLESFFAPLDARLEALDTATIPIPFPSPQAALDAMLRYSGPWQTIFEYLPTPEAHAEARAIMTTHLTRFATPARDGIHLEATYAIARIRRL